MAETINSSGFPCTAEEAIALLYVQNQDLSGKSPAEIYTLYQEAYYKIRKDKFQKQKSGWFKTKQAAVRQG